MNINETKMPFSNTVELEADKLREAIKKSVLDFIDKSNVVPGIEITVSTHETHCMKSHYVEVKINVEL